jgi:hypothetical protein
MQQRLKSLASIVPLVLWGLAAWGGAARVAVADPGDSEVARAERCATRMFISMVGDGAPAEALASATPQTAFDTLVRDPRFTERFARFVNSNFNRAPGPTPTDDEAYYLTKHVLENNKAWSEMFLGAYDIVPSKPADPASEAIVKDNPNGLGYFRTRTWTNRYAGNEGAGVRISAAYRILRNTVGLNLTPVVTPPPGGDASATGRKAGSCAGCHYNSWFALDKVANLLGTQKGKKGTDVSITPSTAGPQVVLGGLSIGSDKELVSALVQSEAFDVGACRLAFKFLYGRYETTCEGGTFDQCVAAFKKDKRITSALATLAKAPTFCE